MVILKNVNKDGEDLKISRYQKGVMIQTESGYRVGRCGRSVTSVEFSNAVLFLLKEAYGWLEIDLEKPGYWTDFICNFFLEVMENFEDGTKISIPEILKGEE